ncbi:DUF4405 domain-containing protein [Litorivita sp. NS0012-18]|uniref:DUF4405 domain-containing protein n=1 Tax=Litorivita sp. NS0012-18 TaxID=3127655 RepID=UPI00310ABCE2
MTTLRRYATPITIGSFLLMAVTGVLMFFHLNSGLNKLAHEWIGLIMIAAVLLHVALNWRAFTLYFKRPLALILMAGFAGALSLSFLDLGAKQRLGRPDLAAVRLLAQAPVEVLAPVLGTDTKGVIKALEARGHSVFAGQSLADITGAELRAQAEMIAQLSAAFDVAAGANRAGR